MNTLGQTRYGPFLYNAKDVYIGRALELYGEAHQLELEFLQSIVGEGGYIFDVGANIGGHTVPLARHVGPKGRIFAFEPQRIVFQLLCANLALANLENVEAFHAALGSSRGEVLIPEIDYEAEANYGGVELEQFSAGLPVLQRTLDEFAGLPRVDLIKIDVEGMERDVLEGGKQLIAAFRPLMYVENDRDAKSAALIEALFALEYRLFWHLPPLFNPENFRKNRDNVFGPILSWNMLCVPRESVVTVTGFREIRDPGDGPFSQ